jgi:methyl-accepting chemotaxis protein
MKKNKNRRKLRNYLIHREILLRLGLLNVFFAAAAAAAVIFAVLPPVYDGFQNPGDYQVQGFAAKTFVSILDRLVGSLSAILILGALYTIVLSHRFSGPLVNLSHTIKRISDGDFTRPVRLRRWDFLKKEAALANRMNEALAGRFALLLDHQDLISMRVAELARLATGDRTVETKIAELSEAFEDCRQILSDIKINQLQETPPGTGSRTPPLRTSQGLTAAED